MVIDVEGITLTKLVYIRMIKSVLAIGKRYFPELTKSVTIVNAPWVFAKFYTLISPALTPVMRKKVCIVGSDFEEKLLEHGNIKKSSLPRMLGGKSDGAEILPCDPVPNGYTFTAKLKSVITEDEE